MLGFGVGSEFVVTAAHILDERVTFDDDVRGAVAFQPSGPRGSGERDKRRLG